MATATMATAVGVALLYYTLNRKLQTIPPDRDDQNRDGAQNNLRLGIDRVSRRYIQAPATWLETISTLAETLRFTYSETLGKWPIGDLAFGINFLLKRQGNLNLRAVFGGDDSVQLKGQETIQELRHLLELLTLCWHFSKKPFPLFLEEIGFSEENVLLQKPKAGILKPAFTILVDHKAKCFLLLIRGTHSIKDTLTAATGAVVPFHHTLVHEGRVRNLVLGHAHCGMVAAAQWISKLATPHLKSAIEKNSDYKLKVVGHSLGGGTAALLTYVLREQKELSATTCVTFAPGACMTWELAESGKDFITSVINGADLVPTFSAALVDDLRAEVTASAWLNELTRQIEQTRILSTVYRSASALGSRLPSMATARAKVAGAGAILGPVSSSTQVVMKRAKSMARAAWTTPSLRLSSWSCIGPRKRSGITHINSSKGSSPDLSEREDNSDRLLSSDAVDTTETIERPALVTSWSNSVESFACQAATPSDHEMTSSSHEVRINEFELLDKLENELYDDMDAEGVDEIEEIREAEDAAVAEVREGNSEHVSPETKEAHRFFPPGRIVHMITYVDDPNVEHEVPYTTDSDNLNPLVEKIGIFQTPRNLYSKLRLSQTMISDHFMPVYRRQLEKLIKELEQEVHGTSQPL